MNTELMVCNRCGLEQPLEAFRLPAGRRHRRQPCVNCESARSKAWSQKNPDRVKELAARWLSDPANRERQKAYAKEYQKAWLAMPGNRERQREKSKKWYKEHHVPKPKKPKQTQEEKRAKQKERDKLRRLRTQEPHAPAPRRGAGVPHKCIDCGQFLAFASFRERKQVWCKPDREYVKQPCRSCHKIRIQNLTPDCAAKLKAAKLKNQAKQREKRQWMKQNDPEAYWAFVQKESAKRLARKALNPEKTKAQKRESSRRADERLPDYVIRSRLGINKDVGLPPEILEIKRVQLQINRTVKQIETTQNEKHQ